MWIYYLIPLVVIWSFYLIFYTKKQKKNIAARDAFIKAGLIEPPSLHPVININRCMGCGSCVNACPEKGVLGIINDRSHLINPTHCIGHGACKAACPRNAITLVFGTERRGIDIPQVNTNFETNVPGVFVAGELGGMGLIRNAIEQGRQAIGNIAKLTGAGNGNKLDVVIVGSGPAGFSASLTAMQHKLSYATLEQEETLGGTVAHYPRGKVVMTAPVEIPLVGTVKFVEIFKEELLEFWQGVEKKTGVKINYKERLETINRTEDGFIVTTNRSTYSTRTVLLAIGRRGTPRKLGVPGEDLFKVVYRLVDPAQYQGQHVAVVGGGDSALEAATSIAGETGTCVTLCYRSDAFKRAKEKNQQKVQDAVAARHLRVLMKSEIKIIRDKYIEIEIDREEKLFKIQNDAVIVCSGGILPTPFLKKIGITVETKYGTL